MKQHRALYRLSIERIGQLSRDQECVPCRIVDLTAEGVRVETTLPVQVGEVVGLAFALTPGHMIRCGMQVISVHPPYLGGRLSQMSSDDHRVLNTFIEEFLNANFMGI